MKSQSDKKDTGLQELYFVVVFVLADSILSDSVTRREMEIPKTIQKSPFLSEGSIKNRALLQLGSNQRPAG